MALNLPAAATPPIMPVGGNDPLQQLRLAGIFGPTPPNQPIPGSMINQPGELGEIDELGRDGPLEGYDPSYEAAEAFQELLSNYPTEGRGILQKIALSMIGLKDPRLAASLMNQPTSAQQDWQQQIGPAQAGMIQEGHSNTNLRILANQLLSGEQAGQRIELEGQRIGQASERLEETGRHNIEVERLAQWKSEHPNYQLKTREDGMIVGINPQNPQDVQETGVDSGSLSDQQKLDAGIEAAETAEAGRVSRQKTGIEAGQENIQERERLRRDRPASARRGTRSQSDINRGRLNRASDVLARNPEYEKFIKLDGTRLSIEPWKKKGILFKGTGISKEEYDSIVSQIYDESSGSIGTDTGGDVRVVSPDGKSGTIPASQLEAALKEGYTRAQ